MGKRILFPVILFLLALPVAAQDETLQPDAENNPSTVLNDSCSTACNATTCDDDVDEGQGSADGLEVSTLTNNASIIFDFPNPASNPSGSQTMDLVMSRCDDDASCTERTAGTDPPFSAWITCNGTDDTQIFNAQAVTTTDELHQGAFTFPAACAADGSDLGVRILLARAGGGGNRNYSCIEAVDWDVTWASATTPQVIVVGR